MIKSEDIVRVASYFTIIAHTAGRLRVRVNSKIVKEGENIELKDIEDLPKKIDGIKDIKINKVIASITILYDPEIFNPKLWEDLINKRNIEEISVLINDLAKEVI